MPAKATMTKRLNLVLSLDDYTRLQTRFSASTSHSLSAFCRDVLVSQPVVLRYHNIAADEFLVIALEVKHELQDVIHRLNDTLSSPSPRVEQHLSALLSKVDELKLIMHQIYQQWSSI